MKENILIYELKFRSFGQYKFSTSSGSDYFLSISQKRTYISRINDDVQLQSDRKIIDVFHLANLRIKESAIFVLKEVNPDGDHIILVTTPVVSITKLQTIQDSTNQITLDSNNHCDEMDDVGRIKYFYGDYVKFRFRNDIHYGQIVTVDIDGGGIYWGKMTSYDIDTITNGSKMGFKHIPEINILGLLGRKKKFQK